ncbi:MAG: hypothetical protein Q4A58_08015 [Fusobacterium sp.]|uniref:hypothetical protein n=1 Tax=Fusobacterium sp. TaxID=68766 RepID=UPI0026DAEACD|nr:hypothetical protein [Fusobacterium sp.]MDO4691222.1 hypothetical protein [Fusobacterium sp.]
MKKLSVLLIFLILSVSTFTEIVYITPTGKKYHPSKNCPGLARAKQIIPIERSKAEARGYVPCKKGY